MDQNMFTKRYIVTSFFFKIIFLGFYWNKFQFYFITLVDISGCDKIDKKNEKYIFLGYSDEIKGYHLYTLENKKLSIPLDVLFGRNYYLNQSKNKIFQISSYENDYKLMKSSNSP